MLFSRVTFAWANMFCFTKAGKASSSASGGAQSTAYQATNEIILKYASVSPMIQSNSGTMEVTSRSKRSLAGQPILDVVKAEMDFGISFFGDFCGVENRGGQYRMVFTARFQKAPDTLHLISCPKVIRAGDLSPAQRESLRINLEAVSDRMAKEEWDKLESRFEIVKRDWLIVLDA
ncbi:hypothetical protein CNMCM8980_005988 [Aspergillus fumigatiaffinis]|jgi:hypothetical protein|uniref:Uncharacterized protein n=1 Tax=Aspergillus fumigatiaffinis TaxID=340414 RepID=A0A8H4M3F9_9EURO|nr:hypothetical protein CNMCM6805_002588 [Aspergillus fumigatiaffinis]KAF4248435.1 hypothetical protein CNMCM8980_005988 [Aspergillus fumigatiaffinis]